MQGALRSPLQGWNTLPINCIYNRDANTSKKCINCIYSTSLLILIPYFGINDTSLSILREKQARKKSNKNSLENDLYRLTQHIDSAATCTHWLRWLMWTAGVWLVWSSTCHEGARSQPNGLSRKRTLGGKANRSHREHNSPQRESRRVIPKAKERPKASFCDIQSKCNCHIEKISLKSLAKIQHQEKKTE